MIRPNLVCPYSPYQQFWEWSFQPLDENSSKAALILSSKSCSDPLDVIITAWYLVIIVSLILGYDISSYDIDNDGKQFEIKIEVKTTQSKVDTEFLVSKNEVETSKKYKDRYCVYRVYDLKSPNPKFYRAFGEIEKNFDLDPYTYLARYKNTING